MLIKCTQQELKELIENKKETPVAGTTDVKRVIEPVKNALFIDDIVQIISERNSKKINNKIKITCSNCSRTDYYKVMPSYCAFCGKKLNDNSNHKK